MSVRAPAHAAAPEPSPASRLRHVLQMGQAARPLLKKVPVGVDGGDVMELGQGGVLLDNVAQYNSSVREFARLIDDEKLRLESKPLTQLNHMTSVRSDTFYLAWQKHVFVFNYIANLLRSSGQNHARVKFEANCTWGAWRHIFDDETQIERFGFDVANMQGLNDGDFLPYLTFGVRVSKHDIFSLDSMSTYEIQAAPIGDIVETLIEGNLNKLMKRPRVKLNETIKMNLYHDEYNGHSWPPGSHYAIVQVERTSGVVFKI